MKLGLLIVFAFSLSAYSETIYFSKIKKTTPHQFLNRIASKNAYYVLSRSPISKALQSASIKLNSKNFPHLIELPPKQRSLKVPGEVARIDHVVFSKHLSLNQYEHLHHIPFLNIEGMENHETTSLNRDTLFDEPVLLTSEFPIVSLKETDLQRQLEKLTGESTVNIEGQNVLIKERKSKVGRKQARHFLHQHYKKLGIHSFEHDFVGFNFFGRHEGSNVIAEIKGENADKFILVIAHMDTVDTAGADDNGTGTVIVMSAAQKLSKIPLKYSVRFVHFDKEEAGIIGSKEYVRDLKKAGQLKNILGVVNLEMAGYDSDKDGAFHIIDCEENTSAELSRVVENTVKRLELNLKKTPACTNRSDHASFWREGIPAIALSQDFFGNDANPCYHKACDTIKQIDYSYFRRIADATVNTVIALAGKRVKR